MKDSSFARYEAEKKRAEKAEAELADTTRALHEKCEACEVGRGLQARAEKAEAELSRKELERWNWEQSATHRSRERDEARAEVARLQDLHTRCAAFDDQPGPSCVTLAAKCAALREALEKIEARCARISEETLEVFQLRHEIREVRLTARAALATDREGT